MPVKKNARHSSYFYLLINTVVWGAAMVVVKPSLSFTTPFRYLLYRYALAIIFSLPILIFYWQKFSQKYKKLKSKSATKIKKLNKTNPFALVNLFKIIGLELIGTGMALGLLYWGLKYTSALEANLLTTTLPLFVTIGGIWLLHEKQEKHEWLGLGMALVGTVLLVLTPIFGLNGQFGQFSIWGNLLIIGNNLLSLFYYPLAKKYYQGLPKLLVTTISFYVGAAFFLLVSLIEFISLHKVISLGQMVQQFMLTIQSDFTHTSVWVAALYMAIFGSIIGFTAYIKGQEKIESSEASLFWYLQPLVYIPLGFVLLGDKINTIQVIALLIVLVGVIVAEKRKK